MKISISALVYTACLFAGDAACTKQQTVSAVNTGVQVAVDACKLAPTLIPTSSPASPVIALLCPLIEGGAPTVEVLIDNVIWNAMVKTYQAQHPGFVPQSASTDEIKAFRSQK
jgi:hypothetical protein